MAFLDIRPKIVWQAIRPQGTVMGTREAITPRGFAILIR